MNDVKFICIVGAPGSGKTFFARETSKPGEIIIDDIKSIDIIPDVLKKGYKTFFITDPFFCFSNVRLNAEKILKDFAKDSIVEWIFFENNVDKCWNNVKHRDDGRIISLKSIQFFSERYNPPENCLKIWQKNS